MLAKHGLITAALSLTCTALLFAQSAPPPPQSQAVPTAQAGAPAVHVTTRIVQVRVTVHDKDGNPVTGLTKDDFTLLDQGQRQQITSFTEQVNRVIVNSAAAAPNQFTNRFEQGSQPPLTVVVLDVYNGGHWDMFNCPPNCAVGPMFRAVEKFIRQMQPQDRVALYVLSNQLYLLQDFTSDPGALQRAALRGKEYILGPGAYPPSQTDPIDMSHHTMDAMHEIADRIARVPGRKNLIWLSHGFALGGRHGIISNEIMDKSAKTLGNDDLPLFAIDAIGIPVPGASVHVPLEVEKNFSADIPTPASADGNYGFRATEGGSPGSFGGLRNLATMSGGNSIHNTNDLAGAIRRVIDGFPATYLLSYYPDHNKWNGEFREIKVKVNRPGVEVRSRSGYYAVADASSDSQREAQKVSDAIHGPLESTDLGFDVQADGAEVAGARQLKVKVTLDAGQLRFQQQSGRWTDNLSEIWVQFDVEGKQVGRNLKTINLKPSDDEHTKLLHDGLNISETVPVENNAVEVRLILRDAGNGAIGSVIIPLSRLFPTTLVQPEAKK
jgi:VWFA-related protein